jgi:hypothetical protein
MNRRLAAEVEAAAAQRVRSEMVIRVQHLSQALLDVITALDLRVRDVESRTVTLERKVNQ